GSAPSFPVTSSSESFVKLENAHLYLRLPERRLYLKAASTLSKVIREFYDKKLFTEIQPPTLVQNQVEVGSTLFYVDYYGKNSYLTQSSQLYLETVVPICLKSFCMTQSYRAEKSNTRRHLSEYLHVEAELADIEFNDLLNSIEDLIQYSTKRFYEILEEEILSIYPDFKRLEFGKFQRLTYKEAISFLNEKNYLTEERKQFVVGDDIPDATERFIIKEMNDKPIFLTNFLIEHKPFYMRQSKTLKDTTESVDLLFPGVGEIFGGSMRSEVKETIFDGFDRENMDKDKYYWYLDMVTYGPSLHGGYGLGFERFLMALMKYDSINEACLYPRFVNRCHP
ncbi:uncharacterized protein AsnRS, partial [Lepeophtheirus salmonis]|uniref:uncharacterized protein AsnRS n=1 Tax=Lepeophtheirus salmonis TaxID=72036 RepID=UPI001AE56E39